MVNSPLLQCKLRTSPKIGLRRAFTLVTGVQSPGAPSQISGGMWNELRTSPNARPSALAEKRTFSAARQIIFGTPRVRA